VVAPRRASIVVTVRYEPSCRHWLLALGRVEQARDAIPELDIATETEVAMACTSPTILVNGIDPFAGAVAEYDACRLYYTDAGIEGAPSVAQIVDALRSAIHRFGG